MLASDVPGCLNGNPQRPFTAKDGVPCIRSQVTRISSAAQLKRASSCHPLAIAQSTHSIITTASATALAQAQPERWLRLTWWSWGHSWPRLTNGEWRGGCLICACAACPCWRDCNAQEGL